MDFPVDPLVKSGHNLALILCCGLVSFYVGKSPTGTCLAVAGCFFFPKFLLKLFTTFRNSFTFGEGCIVAQGCVLYVVSSVISLSFLEDNVASVGGSFNVVTKISMLSVIGLMALPALPGFRWTISPTFFYVCGLTVLASVTLPLLWILLHRNPILWVLNYAVTSSSQLCITIACWATLTVVAVVFVSAQKTRATTGIRKTFHFLVTLVFLSGVRVDVHFTYLASILVLGVFLILEYVRAFGVEPVSGILNKVFQNFLDDKDQGALVLTNIYLLAGVFLPLWLMPELEEAKRDGFLCLLSGVLSIGVGDSAASIVGSKLGRIKWPGSEKTLEGTVASVVAQLAFLKTIGPFFADVRSIDPLELRVCFPIVMVSLLESFTSQVDNLILPLALYSLCNLCLCI